jgi:hypothetical protein
MNKKLMIAMLALFVTGCDAQNSNSNCQSGKCGMKKCDSGKCDSKAETPALPKVETPAVTVEAPKPAAVPAVTEAVTEVTAVVVKEEAASQE